MKIFLSWSGNLSKEIALLLKSWLPSVIQSVEPYMSSEDIDKGTKWFSDISQELHSSSIGIICITKDNKESPWIMFEAGALAEKLDKSRVCPLLIDIKPSDLKSPLSQFQVTTMDKKDILKLLKSINNQLDNKLPEPNLERYFDRWYPDLEKTFNDLIKAKSQLLSALDEPKRSDRDILEEILGLNRSLVSLINDDKRLWLMDENTMWSNYALNSTLKSGIGNALNVSYKHHDLGHQQMSLEKIIREEIEQYCFLFNLEKPIVCLIDNNVQIRFKNDPNREIINRLDTDIRRMYPNINKIEIKSNFGSPNETIISISIP